MKAGQAVLRFPPAPEPARFLTSKVDGISAKYLARIEEDRGLIAEWASVLVAPSEADSQQKGLTGRLLLAEPGNDRWLDAGEQFIKGSH